MKNTIYVRSCEVLNNMIEDIINLYKFANDEMRKHMKSQIYGAFQMALALNNDTVERDELYTCWEAFRNEINDF